MKRFLKNIFTKSLTKYVGLILLYTIIGNTQPIKAQNTARKMIHIDTAGYYRSGGAVVKNADRLLYGVKLTHENTIMHCDSAWFYQKKNSVDAFGRVHIISNDTIHLWANFINFDGNTEVAKATGNVILKDPQITLTTERLDFDLKNNVSYYNNFGKIIDSTNTLTSIVGRYYSETKDAFFKDSVFVFNEDFTLHSDTLKYNTETEIVYIYGETRIFGDSTYLYTEEGWFDTQNKYSELTKNSTIRKAESQLEADTIYYNDQTGAGNAFGNVIINDFENRMIVAGQKADYDDFTKYATVTDSAYFVQYNASDSLFMHADTLLTMPDTSAVDAKMLIAYYDTKFYKTDLQGICDSLLYFAKDSSIHLYMDPVVWTKENQMTATDILLKNNSTPPNEVFLNDNAFIVQEVDSVSFNQIKGKDMIGYIRGQQLYLVDVNGNGQSIFYPSDESGKTGVNKAESSNILIYLKENAISRITFVSSPTGTMNPLTQAVEEDKMLEGFKWRANERPQSKYDLFGGVPTKVPTTKLKNKLPSVESGKKEFNQVVPNSFPLKSDAPLPLE